MKYLFLLTILAVATAIETSAQALPSASAESSPKSETKFDAELAKKVGADQMGMRKYVLAILKTGPKDAEIQGDARKALFKGHFENMDRLAKEGKLAVAGPFNDPQKK